VSQIFDIGLNAKLNEFAGKFVIRRTEENDSEIFENFANYVVASNLLEEELENVKSVSTNKAQGIDGLVIIVNNKLIAEETDLNKFGPIEQIKFKIGFIQSTIKNSFDEQKLSAFTSEVVKFLAGEIDIEPYSAIYKKLLDEDGNFFNRIVETPRVSLFFLSARTSHILSNEKYESEKRKITGRKDIENKCVLDEIKILQKEEIKLEYDKISKFHSAQLKFDKSVLLLPVENVELSLLTTIKFSELKKLILTSDGTLKEKLFIENVRNFIGNTPVNNDIKKTLDNTNDRTYFPFLNNGLSIICDKIERQPVVENGFTLTFPRIINGCQTTNILYKKFKEQSENIDDVEVVAKIISTRNNELKKSIIYAANNQNSIDNDLQSLNELHKKTEIYFSGKTECNFRLFFERLRGQFSSITPSYSKVDIETLARVYTSVFLNKPHEMKSNALLVIEQLQKEGKIFNNSISEATYYYCGVLWYWFNHLLVNGSLLMRSKTMDMHILLACNVLLEMKNQKSIDEKITFLGEETNAKSIFSETTTLLNSKDYLFDRRGFYSAVKTTKLINEVKSATILSTKTTNSANDC